MTQTVQTAVYELSPPVRELVARSRASGHSHVMSAYRRELGPHPRSQLDLLWQVDPALGLLTVQATERPLWPGKLGEIQTTTTVAAPGEHDLIELVVDRSCQKTPPSRTPEPLRTDLEQKGPDGKKLLGRAFRSRLVIVPEDERTTWAIGRLAAIGLDSQRDHIHIGPLSYASLGGKRRGIPYVEIRASARVVDPAKFAKALHKGTGRGRNYGLGLIRVQSPAA